MVDPLVAMRRLDERGDERQGEVDQEGIDGQEQGVEDARRQDIRDRAGAGECLAEVAMEDSAQPVGIPHHRRVVEVHLLPEDGDRLGRRIAAEHARGNIAGQNFDDGKNSDGDDEQGEHRQQDSRDHQPQDCHWNRPTLAVRSLPAGMIIESHIGTTSLADPATDAPDFRPRSAAG